MIEEVINEILSKESEADNIIAEAHNKATEISLKTAERLNAESAARSEALKAQVADIARKSESEGMKRKEAILVSTREEGNKIYLEAQKNFSSAADYIIKTIIGA